MKSSPMKSILVLICIFCASTLTVYAQDDYVITLKEDTLRCKIKRKILISPFESGTENYKYQTLAMTKAEIISLKEIKEFALAKKDLLFRAIADYNGELKFMIVLENGKLCLYEYTPPSYNTGSNNIQPSTSWYLGKGDKVIFLKTNSIIANKSRKERKDEFAEMLKDNKDVYDLFVREDKFSGDEVRRVIQLYNTGQTEIQTD
jgi:hypothetical protein